MDIATAELVVYHLFDVAGAIDLARVKQFVGAAAIQSRINQRPSTPSYIQYHQPPVVFEGEILGLREVDGLRLRIKAFDYGVLSLALSRGLAGTWAELVRLGQQYIENDALAQHAEQACRQVMSALGDALQGPRERLLSEDYCVFVVHALGGPGSRRVTADELLAVHGEDIALLLLGEQAPLSRQEQDEVLGTRISYLVDDLVVPAWSAAFVYDREAGAAATLEILEFANSQLLEFRYYDEWLDGEMARIYADLQRKRWSALLGGGRYASAAKQLHSLFIDVNDLTDRTENALKVVGDVYAARLFGMVASRIALNRWKSTVEEKLRTLDAIFRSVVEQTGMARGQLLELTIIIILLVELLLFFLGVMS